MCSRFLSALPPVVYKWCVSYKALNTIFVSRLISCKRVVSEKYPLPSFGNIPKRPTLQHSGISGSFLVTRESLDTYEAQQSTNDHNEAFRLYYRPLCLYALHYLGDTEEVEDVVQDCFVDLWVRMKADRTPIENVKSYMYSMVRNRCLRMARSPGLALRDLRPLDLEEPLTGRRMWGTFVRRGSSVDCHRCPSHPLSRSLPAQQTWRTDLWGDCPRLDISVNTVRNHVSKALKILKEGGRAFVYYFFFGWMVTREWLTDCNPVRQIPLQNWWKCRSRLTRTFEKSGKVGFFRNIHAKRFAWICRNRGKNE